MNAELREQCEQSTIAGLEQQIAAERAVREQAVKERTASERGTAATFARLEQAEARLADACFHLKCAGRLLETAALDEHGADGDECLEQKRNIDTFLSSPAPPPMSAREERRKAEEPIGCVPILKPVSHSHGLYAVAVCLAHGYKGPESLPCPLCERTAREQAEARMVQEREWKLSETAASDAMQVRAESAEQERDALKLKLEAAKGAIKQALGDVTAGDWMTVKTRFSKATLDKMETALFQLSGGVVCPCCGATSQQEAEDD